MADDERLREALLELQVLREREAVSLAETRTLLECLEAYSVADTARQSLQTVFDFLADRIGAHLSILCQKEGPTARIVAGSDGLVGQDLTAPFDVFARPRNLVDMHKPGSWGDAVDLQAMHAALIVPIAAGASHYALLAFKPAGENFDKQNMRLAQRLSGLAARAYQGMQVEAENTLLAAVIQDSSSGVAIADATNADFPLIYVNSAFERMSGYNSAEAIGQNCRFLNAEEPDAPVRVALRETIEARSTGQFTLRNRRKSGEMFWCDLSIFPVHGPSGAVTHLVATQTDATDRVVAEQERVKSRAQMEQALTSTEDAFVVLESDGRVAFVNSATHVTFPAPGFDWQDGSTFSDNWAAYLRACADLPGRVTALLREPDLEGLAKNDTGVEVDLPDGRSVLFRGSSQANGGMVFSCTDVTAMKAAQRLLAQRLAAIEATRDGLAIADEAGRLVYLNSSGAALLGFQRASRGLGKKWSHQYNDYDPDQNAQDQDFILHRMDDGLERTHEITRSKLDAGGHVIVFRDVTERIQNETRELELKTNLRRLHRQKSMAELTAGIAHDFNNLLSAINGSATLISMDPAVPDSIRAHVERIQNAGGQATRMVNRLLDAGSQAEAHGTFEVSAAMADVPALVEPSLPPGIKLRMPSAATGPLLTGDPSALGQVLFNLILNSRDAIPAREGLITVSVEVLAGRDAPPPKVGRLKSKQSYCKISVEDTGDGIAKESLDRVLEANFTTKGKKGSGLGLAMVAMQLESLGGAVDIQSTLGFGTNVDLYWPLARQPSLVLDAPGETHHNLGGMTIIVVDDEPDVGGVLADYLEALGAEVAVCADPRDAIEAIEEAPEAWSALVTDYDMPHLNGGALTERTRACAPYLPIVIVTALARRLNDPRVTDGQVTDILAKPVDLDRLSALLAREHNEKQGSTHAAPSGR